MAPFPTPRYFGSQAGNDPTAALFPQGRQRWRRHHEGIPMKRLAASLVAVAFLALAEALPAWALDDASFAVAAVSANLQEIQMGQQAQQKAQNPQVKAFGDTLVKDHIAAHQKAAALAAKLEQYAPTVLPGDQARAVSQLSPLSGAAFDRRFLDEVIAGHNAAIQLFTPSATSANPDVKAYATETLATLRAHLASAQALRMQVGG
jgi:putative membrane protein